MGSEVQQDHLGNRAEFIVQLLLRSCTSPTRGSAADPWFPGDGHPLCIGLGYSDLRPINQLVQGMLHSDWPAKPKPGSGGRGLVGA